MANWYLKQVFEFEGQSVQYDVIGDGPPLVLVHGTPWSSFNWRHIVDNLQGSYTLYLFDLLGYGQSEKLPDSDISLGVQNEILCALLDHWQLEKPLIMGHDFGGTTVLRAHLLNQCQFEKMIVVDPVCLAPWGSAFFAHVAEHEAAFSGVPDYIHEAIVTAYVKGAMHNDMPAETLAGILKPWTAEAGKGGFYRQIAQASQRYTDEIEPLYPSITTPTLIVWGENDGWIPLGVGERLHGLIPDSIFVPVANAGHLVQEDNPDALFAAVTEFLS